MRQDTHTQLSQYNASIEHYFFFLIKKKDEKLSHHLSGIAYTDLHLSFEFKCCSFVNAKWMKFGFPEGKNPIEIDRGQLLFIDQEVSIGGVLFCFFFKCINSQMIQWKIANANHFRKWSITGGKKQK